MYLRITKNVISTQVARYSQMSVKKGFKMFGEKAVAAIFKELKHLNEGAGPGNTRL